MSQPLSAGSDRAAETVTPLEGPTTEGDDATRPEREFAQFEDVS
jgi:hypothetical protein